MPSLVAAAALLVDYILTVAVSVAAGVLALTSAAPSLAGHEVELSLGFIVAADGREPARGPGVGLALRPPDLRLRRRRCSCWSGPGSRSARPARARRRAGPDPLAAGVGAVGVIVVLRAFASGAAALTGVEAISNGVSAFRPPQARNAARTLARDGRDRDHACSSASPTSRLTWTRSRAGASPSSRRSRGRLSRPRRRRRPVLRRAGAHVRDPRPRREHVVPGLPATGRGARARPLLPAPVREPRRPARLLERDRRPRRDRVAADLASSTRT